MQAASHPSESRPWNGRAILHVDLDAFFAAVEQLDHPEWRGLPVIVGGDPDKRGVVSTASYEARRFGVHSAMPSARARQLCPQAIWARARFARYHELSDAVFAILRSESPLVQPLSVDEAFLDLTPGAHTLEHPVLIARRIRARVSELGLTASVGVATSKTVAKIASDHDKPDGLTVVLPGDEAVFLSPMPVGVMSGIGPRTADRLTALGVVTLGDLARLDVDTARSVLGSAAPEMLRRAQGFDDRAVCDNDPAKQVSKERTFDTDIRTASDLDAALEALSAAVAHRLRHKGISGRTVTVKVRFSDFSTRTVQRTLDQPTDDDGVFAPVGRELIRSVWTPGVGVRLLGIGLSGFEQRAEQLSLVPPEDDSRGGERPARTELLHGIDAVRHRFGDQALLRGRELTCPSTSGPAEGEPPADV
jgi:DNA polymerase-4